jgi:hypothetical protein
MGCGGAPSANGDAELVNWDRWTVILLKPDCLERDLVTPSTRRELHRCCQAHDPRTA